MPDLSPDELFDSPPTVASPPEVPAGTPSQPEPREQVRKKDGTFGAKHPGYLLEQARDYGVSDEEIAEYTSDQLGRAINIARRIEARARQQEASRQSLERRQSPPAAGAPPPPEPTVEEEYPGLDEAHAPIRQAILANDAKRKALEKKLLEQDQVINQFRAQHTQTVENRLDDAFAELAGYLDKVGDGPAVSCKSEQMQVRGFLLQRAKIDVNKPLPSEKRLAAALKAAAVGLFGEAAAKKDPDPNDPGRYGPSPEDWAKGTVQRPTARKGGKEPDGEQKAITNLTQKMREQGVLPGQMRNEILDALPD